MAILPDIKTKIEARLAELELEREQLQQVLSIMQNTLQPEKPKLADAIKEILEVSPPLQLRNILSALKVKGYVSNSKNPSMTIYSAMARHPETFDKTSVGWVIKKADGHNNGNDNDNK